MGWMGGWESSYLVLETAFCLNVIEDLAQFFILEAALQTTRRRRRRRKQISKWLYSFSLLFADGCSYFITRSFVKSASAVQHKQLPRNEGFSLFGTLRAQVGQRCQFKLVQLLLHQQTTKYREEKRGQSWCCSV